jgi:hypothetical protein
MKKKDLIEEISKLKKEKLLEIFQNYCPSKNKKGGFLFFNDVVNGVVNERSNNQKKKNNERKNTHNRNLRTNNNELKKQNNSVVRQEIIFDSSKLGVNSSKVMNNNTVYNVIDYQK